MKIIKAISLGYVYFKVKTSNGNSYLKLIKILNNKDILIKNFTTNNQFVVNIFKEVEPFEKINFNKISLENSMFSYGYKPSEKKQKTIRVRFRKSRDKK